MSVLSEWEARRKSTGERARGKAHERESERKIVCVCVCFCFCVCVYVCLRVSMNFCMGESECSWASGREVKRRSESKSARESAREKDREMKTGGCDGKRASESARTRERERMFWSVCSNVDARMCRQTTVAGFQWRWVCVAVLLCVVVRCSVRICRICRQTTVSCFQRKSVCVTVRCSVVKCVVVCCNVVQCGPVCCSALQRVAARCNVSAPACFLWRAVYLVCSFEVVYYNDLPAH